MEFYILFYVHEYNTMVCGYCPGPVVIILGSVVIILGRWLLYWVGGYCAGSVVIVWGPWIIYVVIIQGPCKD